MCYFSAAVIELENIRTVVRENTGGARIGFSVVQGSLSEAVTIRLLTVNIDARGKFLSGLRLALVPKQLRDRVYE